MKKRTLQQRLLIYFVLVALIPAIFITSFYFQSTQSGTRQRLADDSTQRLTHAMGKIENKVVQINEFAAWIFKNEQLSALLARPDAAQYGELSHEAARTLRAQFSYRPITQYILSLFVLGDNGLDIRSGTEASLVDLSLVQPLLKDDAATDTYWGCLIDNPTVLTEDKQVIFYRHPMTDPQTGVQTGWLLLLFSPQVFSEECADLTAEAGNHVQLYNRAGGLLSDSGEPPPAASRLHLTAGSLSTGWQLSADLSAAALAEQRRAALWSTAALIFFTLAMAALLAWFLSRNLTRPIERIMQTVTRISHGDFACNHPDSTDATEIGLLEKHIGDMGDSIESLLHEQLAREKEKQRLEMKILQNQLNPHFLYNTLNSIKVMAALQGKTGIQNMIEALGRLLRANLSTQTDTVPLARELELLDSYVYIQNMSRKGSIRYRRDEVDETLLHCPVPKFLLQPIVENAILHGLAPKPQGGLITVGAQRDGRHLVLTVTDDGVGVDAETLQTLRAQLHAGDEPEEHGIGLGNTQHRLRLQYGAGASLTITSAPDAGTTVTVRLPFLQEGGMPHGGTSA